MKKLALVIFLSATLLACEKESDEDLVGEINKDGSIEVVHKIDHTDSFELYTTITKVWIKNKIVKTTTITDTLPSLGTTKEEAENDIGDVINTTVPKQYEFYVTVQ